MGDNEILDLYFKRQESAIEESRRKYGLRLFKTSRNILYSNEDADECVNDTLLRAWNAIPPSRPAMLGAFLAKIVRNLSFNKLEAKSAAKRGGGNANVLFSELEDCIPSSANSPEAVYEAAIVTEAINSFLTGLNKAARVAFVLRYFHGESIRDIAERYKISESKVKSLLFRTRKKLRTHLEKEGVSI